MRNLKTYIECLEELSEIEVFDGLVGYGLFAERIPPFLSSENFLSGIKTNTDNFGIDNKPRKFISYDTMRNINVPRGLSIPHPIVYAKQSKTICDNWDKIKQHFKDNTKDNAYKVSRIHIRKIDNSSKIFQTCYEDLDDIDLNEYPDLIPNHIFEMGHKNFCTDDYPEPKLLIGKKYLVRADISNCFPSIYTHSIPWALVGKEESKNNTKEYNKWYNKIDEDCRNLKEAETHGILIGPHTSNIISEIVLVCIDKELINKKYEYIRNIDDYTCYVKTHEEAEMFLIELASELKKYNLVLNHKKTDIVELPLASTEHWIRKINTFIFPHEDIKIKLSEIRAFLDIALDLMKDNMENSAILNYAIKVISNKKMTENAKQYFIDTIHHLVLIYPYLIHLLEDKIFIKFNVSELEIKKITKNIFEIGKEKKLYEAISYAIHFSIKYNFKLTDDLFDYINENRDTVLMLLAYLHDKKFLNSSNNFNRTTIGKKYTKIAKDLHDDIDEYWLFVYEVLTIGNLQNEWSRMKKENISFIKNNYL
jgi:hypothetical protein